jgi:hypothetical protein
MMLGKWDAWYKNAGPEPSSFRYGNTATYQMAADFLADMDLVEDWGCGLGGFKRVCTAPYWGIDGSKTPIADVIADLCTYRSNVDGIMMRHVLEHNYNWMDVLENAVASFRKKFCLILFTPFQDETREIAHNRKHGVDVPTIGFKQEDIEKYLKGMEWSMQTLETKTVYKMEHIYYIEKPYGHSLPVSKPERS